VRYIRKKGAEIRVQDLPQIIEEAWEKSNSSFNIKNGFKKVGLFPFNANWLSQNENVVRYKMNKHRFNGILKKVMTQNSVAELSKNLDPLNLALAPTQSKTNRLHRALSLSSSRSEFCDATQKESCDHKEK